MNINEICILQRPIMRKFIQNDKLIGTCTVIWSSDIFNMIFQLRPPIYDCFIVHMKSFGFWGKG